VNELQGCTVGHLKSEDICTNCVNCEQVGAGKEAPVVCFESYSASNRNEHQEYFLG